MKYMILKFAVVILNILYAPIRMCKMEKRVTFISRQSDTPGVDIRMLAERIKSIDSSVNIVILSKKIGETKYDKVKFCFHILKQMYYISTSKVVVIDGYCPAVSVLKHKKSLRVIQIWHAVGAIKMFGYQILGKEEGHSEVAADILRMHKNYNLITCVSEVTKRYFVQAFNVDNKIVKVLGMPRVDYIKSLKVDKKEFYKEYPQYIGKEIILYVPTFRMNEDIDLNSLAGYVDCSKYAFIVKKHPLDMRSINEEFCVGNEYDTYQMLNIADYIITDYSALGIEASLLRKPVFFYIYDYDSYIGNRGINVDLKDEMSEAVDSDFDCIINKIKNGEYNFEQLNNFRNRYIETEGFNNTEKIAFEILKYIGEDFFEYNCSKSY